MVGFRIEQIFVLIPVEDFNRQCTQSFLYCSQRTVIRRSDVCILAPEPLMNLKRVYTALIKVRLRLIKGNPVIMASLKRTLRAGDDKP
ncbi:hypothetical protein D1872_263140 [compost metagenome]